jgi:tetratricopeptide (TPR) repeat protein
MSAFVGGATSEALRSVVGKEISGSILDQLESLVSKHLIRHRQTSGPDRYEMLETVHAFAREATQTAGNLAKLQRAHAEYFANRLEEEEREVRSNRSKYLEEDVRWRDLENKLAACEWAIEVDDRELAHRLLIGEFHRKPREALNLALKILEMGEGVSAEIRGKTLYHIGLLFRFAGRADQAKNCYLQAISLLEGTNARYELAAARCSIGMIYASEGNFEEAEELQQAALVTFRSLDSETGMAFALNRLGEAARIQGLFEKANQYYLELDEIGSDAVNYWNLAAVSRHWEENVTSMEYSLKSLALAEANENDTLNLAYALWSIAATLSDAKPVEAVRWMSVATTTLDWLGVKQRPPDDKLYEAEVAFLRGTLGDDAFEDAWQEGGLMELEETVGQAKQAAVDFLQAFIE